MKGVCIPTLRTERLTLRPQVISDYPAYADFLLSPRAIHMGGPFDTFAAWGLFCHDIGQWQLFGHGALMIDLTETGTCIGQVGINHGPLFPEKELGWLLYAGSEGQGYALEAAQAMLRWAFDVGAITDLVSYCDPANARSIAVAEKLGAVRDPLAAGPDPEDHVFRHRRR